MPIDSGNLALKGLDELFSTEEKRQEEQREQVQQIPIDELHPFTNHPFKVVDDEAMTRTVESIAQFGVLAPLIARPRPDGDGYEIISGHRRQFAAKMAGLETLPVIVRDMDDDAATILMVDSNLQREHISPSERAFAYKMKMDAMKRTAGRPPKENPRQVVGNFETADLIGKESGESGRQVQRFIRLTNLIPELLDMVDEKKVSFNPAVELSYLSHEQQQEVINAMDDTQNVEITETLQRTVSVEAASQEEAEKIVTKAWNNEDYVLDSADFVGVDFKTVGEQELSESRKMEVLLVQPGMYPQKATIGTELKDFQDAVGGTIAASYPFDDPVAIVYNDEGKLTGLPLNRALRDEDGRMYDAVAGTFLVVGLGEEDFASLSPELAQKYEKQFHQPETFLKLGNRLLVIPVPDDAVKSAENKVVIKPPAEHDR